MEKKTLGKGLSTLFAEASSSFNEDSSNTKTGLANISLNEIIFNEHQPRKNIKDDEIIALSDSIKAHGIIQPILVRKTQNNMFQIIAGERRYHAAKLAGLSIVPAIIKQSNDINSFEISVIENIQRENLSVIEEAQAYIRLIDEYGHTQESLSKRMGKSRSHISNTIRLLKLPDDVIELLKNNKISPAHARAIINTPNPSMLAKIIVEKKLNVRETEKLASNAIVDKQKSPTKSELNIASDDNLLHIERMLSRSLGADVRIKQNKNDYCYITIKCRGMEPLDEIISKLEGSKFDL